jgi:hypothetical protein
MGAVCILDFIFVDNALMPFLLMHFKAPILPLFLAFATYYTILRGMAFSGKRIFRISEIQYSAYRG